MYPNLAGVATEDLVQEVNGGAFKASYINWSRTMHLLRVHAAGWLPEIIPCDDGGLVHRAPVGGYLLIRFIHSDGIITPPVPQAIMDNRNAAIPYEKITARDITDTHRRGVCMAAALTFGLAYELWAKMPLESGYAEPHANGPKTNADEIIESMYGAVNLSDLTAIATRGIDLPEADQKKIKAEYAKIKQNLEGAAK